MADLLHIAGRALMAVGIGWGYLGAVVWLDAAGVATWAATSKFGPLVMFQTFGVFAIAFGATGARIGYQNVQGREASRALARIMADRRDEVRRMGVFR
jgi:hypothetical protein